MRYIPYIIIIIIVFILTTLTKGCRDNTSFEKERKFYLLNDSILQKRIIDIRDSSNREITEYSVQNIQTNQLLASNSQEVQQLRKDLDLLHLKLKNVKSSTIMYSITKDTIIIPIGDTIRISKKDTSIIVIPFNGDSTDTWISITGDAFFKPTESAFIFKEIKLNSSISNSTTETHVLKKRFLRKSNLELVISQSNPHTTTGKVQNYNISISKKWYEKWYIYTTIGIIGTLYLSNQLK